jgi:hypothetical protein
MSLNVLALAAQPHLPRNKTVSGEVVRRYELGVVAEDKADVLVVLALAAALGCRIEELSPVLAAEQPVIERLLSGSS